MGLRRITFRTALNREYPVPANAAKILSVSS